MAVLIAMQMKTIIHSGILLCFYDADNGSIIITPFTVDAGKLGHVTDERVTDLMSKPVIDHQFLLFPPNVRREDPDHQQSQQYLRHYIGTG
jgi:hypothetical protein